MSVGGDYGAVRYYSSCGHCYRHHQRRQRISLSRRQVASSRLGQLYQHKAEILHSIRRRQYCPRLLHGTKCRFCKRKPFLFLCKLEQPAGRPTICYHTGHGVWLWRRIGLRKHPSGLRSAGNTSRHLGVCMRFQRHDISLYTVRQHLCGLVSLRWRWCCGCL